MQNILNPISEHEKMLLNLNDLDYQAYNAFKKHHELRYIWKRLSKQKKVNESHNFYDKVWHSPSIREFVSKEINEKRGPQGGLPSNKYLTWDHPFSARIVMRIFMDDWPPFMNNFDEYKIEFKKLTQQLGISNKQNQNVKVQPTGDGEIKTYKTINDRYSDISFVENIKNGEKKEIKGFPLEVPEWYKIGEEKRLCN